MADGPPPYLKDAPEALALYPEQASSVAAGLDQLSLVMTLICAAMVLLICGLMVWFSIRYRWTANVDRRIKPMSLRKELTIEGGWSLAVLVIFLGFFFWGTSVYMAPLAQDVAAHEVNVIGKQWMWKIRHPNGVREINELHVPAGERIRLRLTSQDVIHSFYVPAFRLKRDVLPQSYASFWFEATTPGVYSLYCAEFCGTDHSKMRGRVVVMAPDHYEAWVDRQDAPTAPAQVGRNLFTAYGCSGCHAESSDVHAPPLAGVYGRPVQLEGGGSVIADHAYMRDSILLPRKHVVAGYEPIMPSFQGQITEGEILSIIAYIRSLGEPHAATTPGAGEETR